MRDRRNRALVAAGTAAGFAYNTPLAAVLFVLEVVIGVITIDVVIPVAVAERPPPSLRFGPQGGSPARPSSR